MKTISTITKSIIYLFIGATSVFFSCEKDETSNDNGFSEEITNFVPDSTMDKLKEIGMVIHEGKVPPQIEGTFFASPLYLKSSCVPNEPYNIGKEFIDYDYEFYNQDNKKLAISLNTNGYNSSGSVITSSLGNGAFISGRNNLFTAFVVSDGYVLVNTNDTAYYQTLEVISGTIAPEGITNFHSALWMLNNYDDPYNVFIPNNTGRVFYDGDSLATRNSIVKSANILRTIENAKGMPLVTVSK